MSPPERFFRRFPQGPYDIEVVRGGERFKTTVVLSHVLAAPPSGITVNRTPAAESCDDQPLPRVAAPVTIDWKPVRRSHPRLGARGPVNITRYQFFVERGDVKLAVDLPTTITRFSVPARITAPGGTFKFEIIARNGLNNTAVESCFIVVR